MAQGQTPGPWEVTGQSEAGRYISVTAPHPKKNGRKTICRVPFSADPGPYTDDGDARLIAAAPDLLEALKKARAWAVLAGEDFGRDPTDSLAQIDAAISKATGG